MIMLEYGIMCYIFLIIAPIANAAIHDILYPG